MFSEKQLQPPSEKQLSYIRSLEYKSKLKFYGTTTRDAMKFIERAKKVIIENQIIANKLKREKERGASLSADLVVEIEEWLRNIPYKKFVEGG